MKRICRPFPIGTGGTKSACVSAGALRNRPERSGPSANRRVARHRSWPSRAATPTRLGSRRATTSSSPLDRQVRLKRKPRPSAGQRQFPDGTTDLQWSAGVCQGRGDVCGVRRASATYGHSLPRRPSPSLREADRGSVGRSAPSRRRSGPLGRRNSVLRAVCGRRGIRSRQPQR